MNRKYFALVGAGALAVSLAACGEDEPGGGNGGSGGSGGETGVPWTLGTTDTVTALDPAGSYDLGSSTLEYNLYQTLVTVPAKSNEIVGDAATECAYDDPQTLTCTLNEGLKFSNGNDLTSSDVKYSFERSIAIQDPNGAAIYLLGSITDTADDGTVTLNPDAIETPDDTTVIFNLDQPDTTFQYVLTYPGAGAIVDEETFPADEKLADEEVVGSGPYKLSQYESGVQATLEANENYTGENVALAPQVFIKYFAEASALKLAAEAGEVDVAWRSLSPTDVADLEGNDDVTVATGEGAEIRYWVWKVDSEVGEQAAIRQAAAQVFDREAIAANAYDGTVDPLYSIVPPGYAGQVDAFQEKYGEPDPEAAAQILEDAGIDTPVKLTVGWTPTHYGPATEDEANEVERQLEESGLFDVDLKSTEWEQYQTIYKEGAYDLFILGWYPDFLDADNYLSPFIRDGGFFENGYSSEAVNELLDQQLGETDTAAREEQIGQLQDLVAEDVPLIPSWFGKNVAVANPSMEGVGATLDPTYIFRLWMIGNNA